MKKLLLLLLFISCSQEEIQPIDDYCECVKSYFISCSQEEIQPIDDYCECVKSYYESELQTYIAPNGTLKTRISMDYKYSEIIGCENETDDYVLIADDRYYKVECP
jgi:hypothetical protein